MEPLIQTRGDLLINIDQLNGVINERCLAYVNANDDVARKAALQEYVEAVIEIIRIAAGDPIHRVDTLKQAQYTIGFHMRNLRHQSIPRDQWEVLIRERTYQFDIALMERILDLQLGNSNRETDPLQPAIDQQRESLRESFGKIVEAVNPNPPKIPIE